jgi:hypothetical protein
MNPLTWAAEHKAALIVTSIVSAAVDVSFDYIFYAVGSDAKWGDI